MIPILAAFDPETLTTLAVEWGGKVLLALAILIIGWKASNWAGNIVGRAMDSRGIDPTLKPFLCSLVSALIKVTVVVSAIQTIGIQATSFAAILAAAGLAIGMALSGTLQNFAGGVILLILRPFKVGDVIETQGFIGTVREIQIFQTIMLTGDNKMIHIPNGKLSNESLINYSTMPTRRVDLSFGIGYDDDIDEAREVIAKVIGDFPQVHKSPEPMIKVGELADSSVNFTVRLWVDSGDYWTVHFGMNEGVKKAMDAAGISIPFPQTDVHFHKHEA